MKKLAKAIITSAAICVLVATNTARGQSSRDELIAQGAKQLSAAELRQLLSGKEISGPTFGQSTIAWTLKPDGSFSGWGQNMQGEAQNWGTWNVNDKGQFCVEGQARWYGGSDQFSGCTEWFRLGSNFYAVRDGRAVKRQVK